MKHLLAVVSALGYVGIAAVAPALAAPAPAVVCQAATLGCTSPILLQGLAPTGLTALDHHVRLTGTLLGES